MEIEKRIVTERFESLKIDKAKKLILFCGIAMVFILVIKFLMGTSSQITSLAWWFEILLLVSIPIYILVKNQKQFTARSGRFIEWTSDSIVYKLKNEVSPQKVQRDQIEIVNIHLETIEIITKTNEKFLLDISDFDKYEDRLKIKNNFEIEKNFPQN